MGKIADILWEFDNEAHQPQIEQLLCEALQLFLPMKLSAEISWILQKIERYGVTCEDLSS